MYQLVLQKACCQYLFTIHASVQRYFASAGKKINSGGILEWRAQSASEKKSGRKRGGDEGGGRAGDGGRGADHQDGPVKLAASHQHSWLQSFSFLTILILSLSIGCWIRSWLLLSNLINIFLWFNHIYRHFNLISFLILKYFKKFLIFEYHFI